MQVKKIKYEPERFKTILPDEVVEMVSREKPFAYGLFDEDTMVGLALLAGVDFGKKVQLLYIVVDEEMQRKGIGSEFLDIISKQLLRDGIEGIFARAVINSSYMSGVDNFLLENSFEEMPDQYDVLTFKIDSVKYQKILTDEMAFVEKNLKVLELKNVWDVKDVFRGLNDVDTSRLLGHDIDVDKSVFLEKDGKLVSFLIAEKIKDSINVIDIDFYISDDQEGPILFLCMMRLLLQKILNSDEDCKYVTLNEVYRNAVKKLVPFFGYPYRDYQVNKYYFPLIAENEN